MSTPLPSSGFSREPWQGRVDSFEEGYSQRWHQVVSAPDATQPGIVLLGFACDAGVRRNQGRAGAALAPQALRRALANVPLAAPARLYDAGDVTCAGDALEAAQADYASACAQLLAAGHRVIGIGGGHEIAYAAYCALTQALAQECATRQQATPQHAGSQHALPRIGIINFDAHFDLRAGPRGTSGTAFRQISELCAQAGRPFDYLCFGVSSFANTAALFSRAQALGVRWRSDEALDPAHLPAASDDLARFIAGVDCLYLTVCLDVLPPHLLPGVSAPSARGIEMGVLEALLDQVLASGKLQLADIAELNPLHDIDQRSARVAARLVARIARGWRAPA